MTMVSNEIGRLRSHLSKARQIFWISKSHGRVPSNENEIDRQGYVTLLFDTSTQSPSSC